MTTKTISGWWALALVAALAVGCGGSGSGSGSATTGPSASQKVPAQQANAASSGIQQTMDASNDAIVENGAPGATTAKTGASPSSSSGTTINFQSTVNLTVDLDALNASGQDAYPNASGKFTVSATGTITGDAAAGQATYTVQVTWITDGVFTDPVCGATATVAAGSHWDYSLVVQWAKTDDLNWSIQATADVNGALNATVTQNAKTWTVTGTVTRHASVSFTRTAGNYSFTFGVSGQRTLVVTDGTETHTVISTMSALDHIVIEIDGVVFGPYTLAQIRAWFDYDPNG
ncbi:MAG TPA: hypothetical protein VG457_17830 [Planctomycetota bacterium]|jgi:hypothetical protein|nr:hypothetical protein [Planctomycetota bacterium]